MNWLDRLSSVVEFRLFRIGGEAITPVDLFVFACILILTVASARTLANLIQKRLVRVQPGSRYTLARLAQYLTWISGTAIGLKLLHINLTALAVVAGALGVGIGLGLQSIAANFLAGLVLLFERPIEVGDVVSLQGAEGTVFQINFRSTTILTGDNIAIIVPNSQLVNGAVTNWSHQGRRVRIHVPVSVAYGSNFKAVTEGLLAAAGATEDVLKDPEPSVQFMSFAETFLNFELLAWIEDPTRHSAIRSRLHFAVEEQLTGRGIALGSAPKAAFERAE